MAKKLLIHQIKQTFHIAKRQTWIQQITGLPAFVRYIIGVFLILFGLLGILTPIPLGVVFLVLGITMFFGIAKTRNIIFSIVYKLRIHILYGKIYVWWKNKNK